MFEHFREEVPKQSDIWLQISMIQSESIELPSSQVNLRNNSIFLHESISGVQKLPATGDCECSWMCPRKRNQEYTNHFDNPGPRELSRLVWLIFISLALA